MAEPTLRVYESSTLGMPPLKMVLVHARNEAQNASMRAQAAPAEPPADETPLDKEQAIRRIIEALQELD
jgi:hypothetical protein